MTKSRICGRLTLWPAASRNRSNFQKPSMPARMCVILLFCTATVIAASAQSTFFTTLAYFNDTYGYGAGTLVQATDGNFYGTAGTRGAYDAGTVFKVTPSGTLTVLYNFCSQPNCSDGFQPTTTLVQASDGNLYGTTTYGGANNCSGAHSGCGTVFKITLEGTLTTVYSFDGPHGSNPYAGLVQASDGNFYGTTFNGGINGSGVVFKITPSGGLTTLHNFDGSDGLYPYAALVQASDGNLYGTTGGGGEYNFGTVFKITPAGMFTTLHSFDLSGDTPAAPLVQANDGNLYGTAEQGETVFQITLSGTLTTLHTFDGSDGIYPLGLVQAGDGNFYGVTYLGGANGSGTVYELTPSGTLTTLHNFNYSTDGQSPGGLVIARDLSFYGTTEVGGLYLEGTVFRIGAVHTCATCRP